MCFIHHDPSDGVRSAHHAAPGLAGRDRAQEHSALLRLCLWLVLVHRRGKFHYTIVPAAPLLSLFSLFLHTGIFSGSPYYVLKLLFGKSAGDDTILKIGSRIFPFWEPFTLL